MPRSLARMKARPDDAPRPVTDDVGPLPFAVLVTDIDDRVVAWNSAATALLGWQRDDVVGRGVRELLDDPSAMTRRDGQRSIVRFRAAHGPLVPVEVVHSGVSWNGVSGSITHVLLPLDTPTAAAGDGPRVATWTDAAQAIASRAGQVRCISLRLVGIAQLNRGFSRSTGDRAICEIAQRLIERAGDDATVLRVGGSQFMVVVDADDRLRADDLVAAIAAPLATAGAGQRLTAYAGTASGDARSPYVLLDQADAAMRAAGRHGVGSVADADDAGAGAVSLARTTSLLIGAMAQGEITIAMQPVVDLRTGEVLEYETLARWTSPELGVVPAATFVEAAERIGLIHELGIRVLTAALDAVVAERLAGRWRRARVSVNISPSQLLHPRFVEHVLGELARRDLSPEILQLELTETNLVEETSESAQRLASLRAVGVRIALDDVGTRCANLANLRDLPIDEIKISRRFVEAMDNDPADAAIVRAIVTLAHDLALDVVAEGVERSTQHFALLRAGCRAAQGFLYSEPRPAEQLPNAIELPAAAIRTPQGPIPVDEPARLAAVVDSQILDTPREQPYDDLVAAAANLCATPMAVISIVEADRQWFKASVGMEVAETPRGIAFCSYTICGDELMEVPDASVDDRFRDNPLVTGGPHIRFYAGVPLTTSDGHHLGTLCVIDTEQRILTDEQRLGLEWLAGQASALLDRRLSSNIARRAAQERDRLQVERRAIEQGLRDLTHNDALTGLLNRSSLSERLREALDENRADLVSVLMCDLDHFMVVNEALGHSAGDRLIVEVARRLRASVRTIDSVARLGGDEFAVVVAGADLAVVDTIADRILEEIRRPFTIADREVGVTMSIGVVAGVPGVDGGELLRDADTALSQAKSRGGDRVCRFDAAMRTEVMNRLSISSELRTALGNDELFCLYQPEVDARTGRPVGFEALVRWNHPTRGLLPPDQFLPFLGRPGDQHELFVRVLDLALGAQQRWRRNAGALVPVAVNVAPSQLADSNLLDAIARALEAHGAAAETLWIEVVETGLTAPSAIDTLTDIHRLGVHLALDDFGVAYSSMDRLLLFPWEILKIDRSFVAAIGESEHAATVIRAIIGMAHSLDMRVVAEGVETPDQHAQLTDWGCDAVQGFGISMPIPVETAEQFIEQRRRGD